MENAERKGGEQDRQESVCPRFTAALTVDQDDYKNSKYDPTIDEN
jgi:hypothetical protein